MNSGRVSTDQTFFQVGKEAEEHAVQRADPEPEHRGERKRARRGGEVEVDVQVERQDDADEQQHRHRELGEQVQQELGEHRVEQGDHRVGQEPLVRADRRAHPLRYLLYMPKGTMPVA